MRFQFEDCLLDINRRELRRGRDAVHIEPQVFDLLVYLVCNRDRVVSRDDLVAEVWGGRAVSESALATRINAARSAIGDNGRQQRLIKTYWRKGIRFIGTVLQPDEQPTAPAVNLTRVRSHQKPSVAVLPFAILSDDPTQRLFVAGLVEDIADALSQFSWLSVRVLGASLYAPGDLGGVTGVRYLLEGSARTAKNGVRISARLVDAASRSHLWAHRFEGDLDDVFRLQDQLVEGVVGAIVPKLELAEISRVESEEIEALDAYGCTLRGMGSLYRWTRVGIVDALRMFRRAIEIDPEFAPAYGLAAYCYVQRQSYGWFTDRPREVADAVRLARDAAQLGGDDALALSKAAHAITILGGDVESGAALIEQALLCDRHLAAAWYVSGWVQLQLGKSQTAMEHLAHALRLSQRDPLSIKIHAAAAYAHFLEGRYDDGAVCAERALCMRPGYQTALRAAAASHALAGRVGQAQRFMTSMRRHDPALRLSCLHDVLPLGRQQDFSKCADALHRAGLPD